jgi:hypothetical protein|tara:strand:- start:838 stop:1209 length:372 start_codon:yes stop_codon:yes gene_type:complete
MKKFGEWEHEGFGLYEGVTVPLETPMIEFDEEQELNTPKRSSGNKKYVVYVRNPKTDNIKKIEFGDEKGGLTSKINNRDAAKNFASRHNCDTKTDKLTPGYWSCRLPKYASDLGLKGGGDYFW